MTTSCSAIASLTPGSVDDEGSFVEIRVDIPEPDPHDLLVEVHAVSVNPVDVKSRASFDPAEAPKVLGHDAAGVVTAIGSDVTAYAVGDEVFYAGSIGRSGSNSQFQLVASESSDASPHRSRSLRPQRCP